MSKWIRKGDKVLVIAGNDKGKIGTVLSRGKNRVLVQDVNMRTKHMKPRSQEEAGQGLRRIEMPIHISNVQLVGEDDQPIKLAVAYNPETKEKLLVDKKRGGKVTHRPVKHYVR